MKWLNDFRKNGKFIFDLLSTEKLRKNILQALPFWFASLFTGLVAVAYAKVFGYSENCLKALLRWHSWSIFFIAPVCFILAWLIIQLFCRNARGSGIPQVMAALELSTSRRDDEAGKLLGFKVIITKIASSLLMILGGGAVGREGPTIQIAGSVFRMVNKWIPHSWPKLSRQSFILTGAAAGLAAAFNTPLGGIVFAVEELASTHMRYFRTALFAAVIIAGLTAQALLGPYLYLGYPTVGGLHFSIFLSVALTAVIAGLGGSLMCKGILKIMRWKRSFSFSKNLSFVIGAGLLIALLSYFFNSEILGSGKELMNQVLFTPEKTVSWHTMLFRIFGPLVAFNTGAAGGVFAPALAAGAAVGSFISGMFHFSDTQTNIIILSGMVGFLTGVTRTPFTSAILVLEMTDRHSVIFHLMLAALLSNIAALLVDEHSFYEQLKEGYLKDIAEERKEMSSEKEQVLIPAL